MLVQVLEQFNVVVRLDECGAPLLGLSEPDIVFASLHKLLDRLVVVA